MCTFVVMKYSDKLLAQTITQLCLKKGIDHVVISPGSRNSPLIINFTAHKQIFNYSIVDERCAAFFALGIAQQLKKPVALVCTSGSALLNYYPAIAEAFYSDIPLVVLSADRPDHLLEIGDGQTIQQDNVYGKHSLYSTNCKEGEAFQQYNETEINIALNTAIELRGPVHINIPFSEPLYQTTAQIVVTPQNVLPRENKEQPINEDTTISLAKILSDSKKIVVLAGVMDPHSISQKAKEALAALPNCIVLTENTSNLHHPDFFPCIDQLIDPLNEKELAQLQPDVLITLGGMVVSKKIKVFLRNYKAKEHWHIDPKRAYDTYFSLTKHIKTSPDSFLNTILPLVKNTHSDYKNHWLAVKKDRIIKSKIFLNETVYSDFKVYATILKNLKDNSILHLSNSAAIRYAQLFDNNPSVAVYCNRGTSGIDGSTSTAVGASVVSHKNTVFVTGDLSFFYDSNALWNNYIPKSFKIILVNNSGGGIFRILPKAKQQDHFETFFETQHTMTAEHLCKQFNFQYQCISSHVDLETTIKTFINSVSQQKPQLLEIITPGTINDDILTKYFKSLKS